MVQIESLVEDKQDAEAALQLSGSSKDKGKKAVINALEESSDEDWSDEDGIDHLAGLDEEGRHVAKLNELMIVSHLKRKVIAPRAFDKGPKDNTIFENKFIILKNLKNELFEQKYLALATIPPEFKAFVDLMTRRTTSLMIAQKDLGMQRDDDLETAQKPLIKYCYDTGKVDKMYEPLEQISKREHLLHGQFESLHSEVQKLVQGQNVYTL